MDTLLALLVVWATIAVIDGLARSGVGHGHPSEGNRSMVHNHATGEAAASAFASRKPATGPGILRRAQLARSMAHA